MKRIFLTILVGLILISASFAEDESIELTTYYPAPYGDYDSLSADTLEIGIPGSLNPDSGGIQLAPRSNPPTAGNGTIYYDDGSDDSRTAGLYINNGGNWTRAADDNTYLYSAFQAPETFFNGTNNAELGLTTDSLSSGVYICYISFMAKPQTTGNTIDPTATDSEDYVGWFRWWAGYAISPGFDYDGKYIGKGPYLDQFGPWQDVRTKSTLDVTTVFVPFSCFRIFEIPAGKTGAAKIWFWNSTSANRWGVTVKDLRIFLNKLT